VVELGCSLCRSIIKEKEVCAVFRIEDERHGEPHGEFASFEEAVAELRRRAQLPWDERPNVAPCTNWRNCGRNYEVVEYDDTVLPWRELRRVEFLEISAQGARWIANDLDP
jgi:hypothetical protein